MREFEPSSKEEFLTLPNGEYQRLIFMETELKQKEEDHLENFRQYCKDNNINLPQGYDDDSRFALRILQGKKWKYDVAAAEIISHHEWKTATYPLHFDPIKDVLNLGVIYGFKRDNCFRPVIIVDC